MKENKSFYQNLKDCLQDLDVDWQGILQGISKKSCEDKAIEMERKYPYK